MTEAELKGVAMGLTSALTWATSSLLFGRIFERTPAEIRPSASGANLFKNSLAFGVFLLLWWGLGEVAPTGDEWLGLVQSGFLGFAVADTVYFAAIGLCGVQRAAMIGLLNVPIAALLGWWRGVGEPPTARDGTWMVVVLVGVVLVLLDRKDVERHTPRERRLGTLLALLGALVLGTSVVFGREHGEHVGVAAASAVRLGGGITGAFVVAVVVAALRRRRPAREIADLVQPFRIRKLWPGLLIASTFGSVLGLYPYHFALRELDPGMSSLTFAATPLFLLPLGLVAGERPGKLAILGTLVGILGIAGVTKVLDGWLALG